MVLYDYSVLTNSEFSLLEEISVEEITVTPSACGTLQGVLSNPFTPFPGYMVLCPSLGFAQKDKTFVEDLVPC